MAANKEEPTLKERVVPTKSEAKDTGLEAVAIGAIPVAIGLLQAGQVESGVAAGVLGLAALVIKYKTRA